MGFPFRKSRSKGSSAASTGESNTSDAPSNRRRRKFLGGSFFRTESRTKPPGSSRQTHSTPATTESQDVVYSKQPKQQPQLPLIEDDDDAFEVVTPEAREAREKERENIRRQLFSSASPTTGDHITTGESVEVTTDGQVLPATVSLQSRAPAAKPCTVTPRSLPPFLTKTPLTNIPEDRETKGYIPDTPSLAGSTALHHHHDDDTPLANSRIREARRVAAGYRGPVSVDTPDSSFVTLESTNNNTSIDSNLYRGPVSVDTPGHSTSYNNNNNNNDDDAAGRHQSKPFDEMQDEHVPDSPSSPPDVFEDTGDPLETSAVSLPVVSPQESLPEMEDLRDVSTLGRSFNTDDYEAEEQLQEKRASSKKKKERQQQQLHETPEIARQLLGAFQCVSDETSPDSKVKNVVETVQQTMQQTIQDTANSAVLQRVVDLFYDNTCATEATPETKRTYYDEAFTNRFVQRMTTKGAALLYLQAPGSVGNDTLDWKGRTVAMILEKGTSSSQQNGGGPVQPRLEWTTCAGGQTFEVSTTSVGLLNILSIVTSVGELDDSLEEEGGSNELCFFTITTHQGDVYVFEANSPAERDSLVNGLRNVISRLAFHLVVGDVTATAELYHDEEEKDDIAESPAASGKLPALLNPRQTMNRVAHAMLDT